MAVAGSLGCGADESSCLLSRGNAGAKGSCPDPSPLQLLLTLLKWAASRRGNKTSFTVILDAGQSFMSKRLHENKLLGNSESGPACCLVGLHFAEPDS